MDTIYSCLDIISIFCFKINFLFPLVKKHVLPFVMPIILFLRIWFVQTFTISSLHLASYLQQASEVNCSLQYNMWAFTLGKTTQHAWTQYLECTCIQACSIHLEKIGYNTLFMQVHLSYTHALSSPSCPAPSLYQPQSLSTPHLLSARWCSVSSCCQY